MGNRAVITTEDKNLGVYLHWNGGRDSVEPILEYCKLKGYRTPETDCYGWARLAQVIGNFFGGSTSVGIDTVDKLDCDNYDNGTYIIKNWEIVGREYFGGREQSEYDRVEMLIAINNTQPKEGQLPECFFTAKEVKTEDLKVGDVVFFQELNGDYTEHEIIGVGEKPKAGTSWNGLVNGINVKGMPYIGVYMKDSPQDNINNYLRNKTYRVKK